jgi:hypothetical protein
VLDSSWLAALCDAGGSGMAWGGGIVHPSPSVRVFFLRESIVPIEMRSSIGNTGFPSKQLRQNPCPKITTHAFFLIPPCSRWGEQIIPGEASRVGSIGSLYSPRSTTFRLPPLFRL